MFVIIRGGGDIASGIALRLHHAGFRVAILELAAPTAIRRQVAFSCAVTLGQMQVEDVTAQRAASVQEAEAILNQGMIPVLVDPAGEFISRFRPDGVVDAILAKKNLGTKITHAPIVVAVGPGFTAGVDCHAVVETMRGHYLGRVFYSGSAQENTQIPGLIGGYAGERVLRAPADGTFHQLLEIGTQVVPGDIAGEVKGIPMRCMIGGVLRGILPEGTPVTAGMKAGDVDPRCAPDHCVTVSDKALAVGGGVLEALLCLHKRT